MSRKHWLVGWSLVLTASSAHAQDVAAATSVTPAKDRTGQSFFPRLAGTLWDDLGAPAYSEPDLSRRRREDPPFDSPPYPVSEWQLNGSSPIGVGNDGPPYPSLIMDTLYDGPDAQWWKDSRLTVYGWLDVGGNISTSRFSNAPTGYAIRPNKPELDQLAVYLERRPDTLQTDHLDWGFRVMGVYGLDYRFMIAKGIWDEQLKKYHQHPTPEQPAGQLYGYDMPMVYLELYVPHVAEGMVIRVGRFISVPDIEAQLAPDNLLYTHSLMYTYDIYTQIGGIATIKLNGVVTIQLGVAAGNDVAPWERRRFNVPNSGPGFATRQVNHGVQPTGIAMIQLISPEWALGRDCLYLGVNGINDGRFGYNNIQEAPIAVWVHRFNDVVTTETEVYHMYERRNPALGYVWETGVLNYTMFRLSKDTFLTVRNEYFNDGKGGRTGFKTNYSEHTVGITHWFNKLLCFRPEVGYWKSYDVRAFDNGRRSEQWLICGDLIMHF